MSKVFKLRKDKLVGLAEWLLNQKLEARISIHRTKFIDTLVVGMTNLEENRKALLEKYAEKEKNKEGEEVLKTETVDNSTRVVLKKGQEVEFEEKVQALYAEEFTVSITEENKETIECIKHIVLNTDYLFGASETDNPVVRQKKIQESTDYVLWNEAFKNL